MHALILRKGNMRIQAHLVQKEELAHSSQPNIKLEQDSHRPFNTMNLVFEHSRQIDSESHFSQLANLLHFSHKNSLFR